MESPSPFPSAFWRHFPNTFCFQLCWLSFLPLWLSSFRCWLLPLLAVSLAVSHPKSSPSGPVYTFWSGLVLTVPWSVRVLRPLRPLSGFLTGPYVRVLRPLSAACVPFRAWSVRPALYAVRVRTSLGSRSGPQQALSTLALVRTSRLARALYAGGPVLATAIPRFHDPTQAGPRSGPSDRRFLP